MPPTTHIFCLVQHLPTLLTLSCNLLRRASQDEAKHPVRPGDKLPRYPKKQLSDSRCTDNLPTFTDPYTVPAAPQCVIHPCSYFLCPAMRLPCGYRTIPMSVHYPWYHKENLCEILYLYFIVYLNHIFISHFNTCQNLFPQSPHRFPDKVQFLRNHP